jgi:hypothetical protein
VKKRLERSAEHAKRKLFTRPLHKTGAAALCLSGKSRTFQREEGANKCWLDISVGCATLWCFVEKGDRSCGNVLKRQEKMDIHLGENVTFLGFSGKKLA